MTIRKIDRNSWGSYFDRLSKALGSKKVTVEVAPKGAMAKVEARKLDLGGLVYDRKSDVFEVQAGELDHLIHGPQSIFVDESSEGITSVEVIDRDGTRQLISLSEPLAPAE